MSRTESGPRPPEGGEMSPNLRFLYQYRANLKVHSLEDIDFTRFTKKGINTLLLDAEGTFVGHNGIDPNPAAVRAIQKAKLQGIEHIAIISNKAPTDEESFLKLAWWAEQIGAGIVFTPEGPEDRKPSSRMLLKALQYFDISANKALMVGDKLTADIRAANFAGIQSVWVRRFGEADLLLDRKIRRPAEEVARQIDSLFPEREDGPPISEAARILHNLPAESREEYITDAMSANWDPEKLSLEFMNKRSDKISGYGAPMVILPDEVEAAIPDMWYAPAVDEIRDFYQNVEGLPQKFIQPFNKFMYDHGRAVANTMSVGRLLLSVVAAELYKRDHKRAAQVVHGVAWTFDALDGAAAGMSKKGKTAFGGRLDELLDKASSIIIERAIAKKKPRFSRHYKMRTTREGSRIAQRFLFKHGAGVDVSASGSGKGSTFRATLADSFALSPESDEYPGLDEVLQWLATGEKWKSFFKSPTEWLRRDDVKKHTEKERGDISELLYQKKNPKRAPIEW